LKKRSSTKEEEAVEHLKVWFKFPAYTEAKEVGVDFDDFNPDGSPNVASARRRIQLQDTVLCKEEEVSLEDLSSLHPDPRDARRRCLQQAFLVAQLNMLADMCFGRNYLTTEKVREMVTFDMAVHCVQYVPIKEAPAHTRLKLETTKARNSNSTEDAIRRWNNVRSAFTRLINCAYVDCAPQLHRRWNNLVHLFFTKRSDWKKINTSKIAGIAWATSPVAVASDRKGGITLVGREQAEIVVLQQKMIEHLRTNIWSTVTEQFVRTILEMVNFSFYDNTPAKLSDVMGVVSKRLEGDWCTVELLTPMMASSGSMKATKAAGSLEKQRARSLKHIHPASDADDDDEFKDDKLWQADQVSLSYWDSCFDAKRRKRTLRFLDDWKTMFFIISVVFAAVTVGLVAPKAAVLCTESVLDRCKTSKGSPYAAEVVICHDNDHCEVQEGNAAFCSTSGVEECTQGPLPVSPFYIFDMICFCIFQIELTLRMWAVGDLFVFFLNPYSTTDFVVQFLDVIVICAGSVLGSLSGNTKIVRLARMARLARLLKVMRLMKKMRDELLKQKEVPVWKLPDRYRNALKEKLLGLTVMTKVMSRATELGYGFKLRAFLEALLVHKPKDGVLSQGPVCFKDGLFEELVKEANSKTPTDVLTGEKLVTTVAHLIMYEHTPLVQEALQLLMTVHTARSRLVESVLGSQLLWEPEEEILYKKVKAAVDLITNELDTFQLWGESESSSTASRLCAVVQALTYLEDQCRSQNSLWELGARRYKPVFEVQTMMQNLEVDMTFIKWRNSLRWPQPDDKSSSAKRVRQLCARIYRLMICFVRDSPTIQTKVFNHLSIFRDDLCLGVDNVAELIYELLLNNIELLRLVPNKFVDDLFDIVSASQSAVAMRLLAVVIPSNQTTKGTGIKVTRFLTDENKHFGQGESSCFFSDAISYFREQHQKARLDSKACGSGNRSEDASGSGDKQVITSNANKLHASSAENTLIVTSATKEPAMVKGFGGTGLGGLMLDMKQALSSTVTGTDTDSWHVENEQSHLPAKLQCYMAGMDVLSICAAGATNVVEARIQGVLDGDEVLHLMSDTSGALPDEVRVSLARVYFASIIEVETPTAGLGKNLKVSGL
jgi:hypothetical protein